MFRLKDDHVVRLVCNFTDLFPPLPLRVIFPVRRLHKNVLLRTVVNGNRAFGVDMPAHHLDACARQFIKCRICETLIRLASAMVGTAARADVSFLRRSAYFLGWSQ